MYWLKSLEQHSRCFTDSDDRMTGYYTSSYSEVKSPYQFNSIKSFSLAKEGASLLLFCQGKLLSHLFLVDC